MHQKTVRAGAIWQREDKTDLTEALTVCPEMAVHRTSPPGPAWCGYRTESWKLKYVSLLSHIDHGGITTSQWACFVVYRIPFSYKPGYTNGGKGTRGDRYGLIVAQATVSPFPSLVHSWRVQNETEYYIDHDQVKSANSKVSIVTLYSLTPPI